MSARNGDKARFHRERKKKLRKRENNALLRKELGLLPVTAVATTEAKA